MVASCTLPISSYVTWSVPEGESSEVVPKTYITLLWYVDAVAKHSDVHIALAYNWEPAEVLFTDGSVKLASTSDANSVVESLIRGERIKVRETTGVTPSTVQTLKGKLSSLSVEPDRITATVYNMKEPSIETKLYMSIPKLFGAGAKYTGAVTGNKMIFDLLTPSGVKKYTDDEVREFTTWGLTTQQVYKIAAILLS